MLKKYILSVSFFLILYFAGLGQNIAINATGNLPDSSAMLDITSTSKGLLIPRLTTAQVTAIYSPANGLMVYNTSLNLLQVNTGTFTNPTWSSLTNSSTGWSTIGNSNTNVTSNFIGTTDNQALAFRVNNQSSGKIETSTTGNTAFGYQAALNNTGISNTAVGSAALKTNAGGNNNTALGTATLKANVSGNANVAIGANALMSDTSSSNTAIGAYSMQSNTGGNSNTAAGYSSLGYNTTGNGNTGFGAAALQNNTVAINNTAVGNGAMQFNTTGNSNAVFGAFAMQNNLSGSNNVAGGYGALSGCTTGTGSTGIGNQAGATNTTGNYNTLIGYQADVSSANLTNATAIGYNTKVTNSNSLILGNAANVGIGTSTPGNKLEINSGTGGSSGLRLKQLPAGAVLFMSSTADVTQNNNNLYFDVTNYRLSIAAGTSPNSTLQTGGSFAAATVTKTASYTASVSDYTILCNNTSGAITITLPTASGCSGRIYVIKKISAAGNNVVIQGNSGVDTIDGTLTKTLTNQYNSIMIQSDGTNWDILSFLGSNPS